VVDNSKKFREPVILVSIYKRFYLRNIHTFLAALPNFASPEFTG